MSLQQAFLNTSIPWLPDRKITQATIKSSGQSVNNKTPAQYEVALENSGAIKLTKWHPHLAAGAPFFKHFRPKTS